MNKPVVALDVDGVLMNMVQQMSRFIEQEYGCVVEYEDFKHWNPQYNFNMPSNDISKMWDYIWSCTQVPYSGACALLRSLEKTFDVHLVSKRPKGAAVRHAEQWFPQLGVRSRNTHLVDSGQQKSEFINLIKAAFFVDDNPENCGEVLTNSPTCTVFLFTRPWNEGCQPLITSRRAWERVSSYEQLFQRLSRGRKYCSTL